MFKSFGAAFRWAEARPIPSLATLLVWFSLALTFLSEVAAITIMAAISTSDIQSEEEVWTAVWFFAVSGGFVWIVACAGDVESGRAIA
jgi:hypothetical protein